MRVAVALGCAGLFAILVAPVHAAVVRVEGSTLVVEAQPGEHNDPYVVARAHGATVTEFGAPLVAGTGCAHHYDAAWVQCSAGLTAVRVDLGDGDDVIQVDADVPAETHGGEGADALYGDGELHGGPGDDDLFGGDRANVLAGGEGSDYLIGGAGADNATGGAGPDSLAGGGGADMVDGGAGDDGVVGGTGWAWDDPEPDVGDVVVGGPGNDLLDGQDGPDELVGGEGRDVVVYWRHAAPVHADLEGDTDDGAHGEGDRVGADVEDLTGGAGADELVGGDGGNRLEGGVGDDTLIGDAGDDELLGDEGRDALYGARRADPGGAWPHDVPDDDRLEGGEGDDVLAGGTGGDRYDGREGDDRVVSRDPGGRPPAPEPVDCGSGVDHTDADAGDVPAGCEWVNGGQRAPLPPPAVGGWATTTPLNEDPDRPSGYGSIAVDADGAIVGVWEDRSYREPGARVRALVWPPRRTVPPPLMLSSEPNGPVGLAAGGAGNAVATWTSSTGEVRAARRYGDSFREPVSLAGDGAEPTVAMSASGGTVIAWRDMEHGAALWTRRADAVGSWEPTAVAMTHEPAGGAASRALAVTGTGEVLAVYRDLSRRVVFAARRSDGAVQPALVIAERADAIFAPQLAADAAGNAIAVWRYGGRLVYASRRAGEPFGAPVQVPTVDGSSNDGALVVDPSGRVTLLHTGLDTEVAGGLAGEPLYPVARFGTADGGQPTAAVSPSGEAVAAWRGDEDGHWLSVRRAADGTFGPVEDMRPGCDRADRAQVAIGPSGRVAAMFARHERRYVADATPAVVPRQACLGAGAYAIELLTAPDEPTAVEPALHTAAREVPRPPVEFRTPAVQRGRRGRVTISGLRLRGNRARLRVRCRSACRVRVTVVVRDARARALARGLLTARRVVGARTLSVKLRPARTSAGTRRGPSVMPLSAARLSARVVALVGDGRETARAVAVLGIRQR